MAALVGDVNVPAFLVLYQNTDSASLVSFASRAVMEERIYGTQAAPPYSVHTYYKEISDGRMQVNGTVLEWTRLSQNDTYYEGGCNGLCSSARVGDLIREIVQAHDDAVDYGQFDNDGEDGIPNSGDDDGNVDAVVLFHPEVDGACGTANIWAHRWVYEGWTGGASLETSDPSANGGNVRVRDYIIQGGQGGNSGCTSGQPQAMGVVAHETGHLFGLPDLYNTNTSRSSEGIGHWGLMGSGNWRVPSRPAYMEAWSRAQLGWVTEVLLDRDTSITLSPVELSDTVFVVPIAGTDEFYYLENRQRAGSDSMIHGPGLLVWHVDSGLIAQRGLNAVNAFDPEAVRLVQADGASHLQLGSSGGNRGDPGDPYPGSAGNESFSLGTSPAALRNDGGPAGMVLDSIREVPGTTTVAFRLWFVLPTIVRALDTLALIRVDGVQYNRFADLLEDGSPHTIAIDSVQTTADGRRRYTFASWSDGGAREHDITGSVSGDSISADVAAHYLLRATVSGSGAVTSDSLPDPTAGGFLGAGSRIPLRATPAAGFVFDRWTGDASGNTDTLDLTVTRPMDVTAVFAPQLVATPGELRDAVMGAPYLDTLVAVGGIVTPVWQRLSGELPRGVTLETSGRVQGIPEETGIFGFIARVTSGAQADSIEVALSVTAPALTVQPVLRQVVGVETSLGGDEVRYLDLLGNRNGRLDVGDFLAWIQATGGAVTAEEMAAVLRAAAREERP